MTSEHASQSRGMSLPELFDGSNAMPQAPLRAMMTEEPARLPTDDELMELIRGDDQNAYQMLVERHIDRAYALALRVLKSPSDAEDATQDAFVKAWQNRKGWQAGRAQFGTWLYRVIVNRCIDLQRRPRSEWIEDVPEPADEGEDGAALIARGEVYHRLHAALDDLPPQQRIAMVLSYFENMSNGKIAETMETTVAAVESLLKRGRQRLRDLLRTVEHDVVGFLHEQ
jgi:RNA polymerase sigma-70 factor (ECF subfamily)